MYKRYWYTKERNLWIQVNSFKQKTSPPPLPPIFPVFSPVFCDSAIGPCSNLVEPSLFGTNLLKQRMLRDLWRTSAVFAPDSLNKQLSTQFCSGGSKMKSNLKIPKKKKRVHLFHLIQDRMSWLHRLPIWTFPGDPQRLWRSPNSLQPSLYPLPLRDSSVKCAALVWRGSAWNLIFRNINVTMLKIDSNKCVNSACSDFTTVVLR